MKEVEERIEGEEEGGGVEDEEEESRLVEDECGLE